VAHRECHNEPLRTSPLIGIASALSTNTIRSNN
jgi:hypothetical protein